MKLLNYLILLLCTGTIVCKLLKFNGDILLSELRTNKTSALGLKTDLISTEMKVSEGEGLLMGMTNVPIDHKRDILTENISIEKKTEILNSVTETMELIEQTTLSEVTLPTLQKIGELNLSDKIEDFEPLVRKYYEDIVKDKFAKTLAEGNMPEEEPSIPINEVKLSVPRWTRRSMSQLNVRPRHEACNERMSQGIGPEQVSSWYYSPPEGRCLWFEYRGYEGNANRFYTRAACEALCVKDAINVCEFVHCKILGASCVLRGDVMCKESAKRAQRDWRKICPPDQPTCIKRRSYFNLDLNESLIPQECLEEPDQGPCLRKNPLVRFYYNKKQRSCSEFYFNECGGNNNRFETKEQCMSHCSP